MQDKIILGFLVKSSLTGYGLKKIMEESTDFFFNTSLGSIYPAFKKLENKNFVTVEEKIEHGRVKKIYTITEKGRTYFQEWLKQSPEISKVKEEALLKIFFFSNLPKKERFKQIDGYLSKLESKISALEKTRENFCDNKIDKYQTSTLEFGLDYYKFIHKWFSDFIKKNQSEI